MHTNILRMYILRIYLVHFQKCNMYDFSQWPKKNSANRVLRAGAHPGIFNRAQIFLKRKVAVPGHLHTVRRPVSSKMRGCVPRWPFLKSASKGANQPDDKSGLETPLSLKVLKLGRLFIYHVLNVTSFEDLRGLAFDWGEAQVPQPLLDMLLTLLIEMQGLKA